MKRRKARMGSDTGSSPQEKKTKSPSTGSHQKPAIVNFDEIEAARGDAGTDVASYRKACEAMRKLMEEINDLKSEGKAPDCPEITEKRIHSTLLFILLKKLNRLAHVRCKKARDTTQEAKQKVDGLHLQLQNLLYEAMHLKKEITKCLEFKSKDEEIELISEEEFYEDAPKEVSKPETTKADGHQRMLARLDWELAQRKSFASKKEEFLKKKESLEQEIATRREFLNSLQPRLETILKSTHPVQEYLQLPLDAERAQHETAKYLPRPLYVLYVQATAFHEAYDQQLSIQIEGDIDAAKAALEEKPTRPEPESDSDEEATDKPRKSKRRRKKEESRQEEKRKALLKTHPLQVKLKILCKSKCSLTLTVSYLPALHIVTVLPSLALTNSSDQPILADSSLLSPGSLLTCLFPGDHGNNTPNSTNHYQLTKEGIQNFSSCVGQVGRPFMWAQRICGLEFLSDSQPNVSAESSVSFSHMEVTMKAIRARVLARLALQRQLSSLEKHHIPVSKNSPQLFPSKILSSLVEWRPVDYADFVDMPHARSLVAEGLVDETDMLFCADIERNKVHMKVGVVVNQEYPVKPPLVCASILYNGVVVCDDLTRLMEAEANVHYEDLFQHDARVNILANQITRLQMCFDILVECGAVSNAPGVTEHAKLMIRNKRGRDRSLPFHYNPTQELFTHR